MAEMSIAPIVVSDELLQEAYGHATAGDLRFLRTIVDLLPRGKGYVPRTLGKTLLAKTRLVIRMANGVVHAVDPSNLDAYISNWVSSGGTVTEVCWKLLKPGECFFDIGANVGIVSLAVAKERGNQATILAFEPQERIARKIAVSAKLNGFDHLKVYAVAAAEHDEEADFFVPGASTHSSLIAPSGRTVKTTCRTICLDEQVQKGNLPVPQVVKVDVEGAEAAVFRGMRHIIATESPILVFEADGNMKRFGVDHFMIFDFLRSLASYDFYLLRPNFRQLGRVVPLNVNSAESGNYLAVPTGRSSALSRLEPGIVLGT